MAENERILRLPEVKKRVGLSRSSIYQAIQRKVFPSPIPLGARAVGWLESDIAEWLASQIAQRRSNQ
jgi:prophage regulatory protein